MAFDGITMHLVVKELQSCLIGGKIDKIYQPSKNELLLGVYAKGSHYLCNIHISADCYHLQLTTSKKENPIKAPNFCMLLRKYLLGSTITEISTYGLERIVTFHLEGYNALNDKITRYLIIELMGKHSNVILANENKRIIDSLRHLDSSSNSTRDILPAREYVFPNNTKKDFLTTSFSHFYEEVSTLVKKQQDLASSISSLYTGFSYSFIKHLLAYLSIDNWNTSTAKNLFETLQNMLSCKTNVFIKNLSSDYAILPTKEEQPKLFLNFYLDDYYTAKEQHLAFTTYRNHLLKIVWNHLQKTNHTLKNIEKKLQDCTKMEDYRLYGELLTSNLYRLPDNHSTSITLENYYNQNSPITIPLQEKLSPSLNAKFYYKKYRKLKNALEIVSKQKKEILQEIHYLESIVYEIENSKTLEEIDAIYLEISDNLLSQKVKTSTSSKKNSSRQNKNNYLSYSIGTYTLLVGKNNLQNDELTCKIAHNHDIWFHTKDIHGSHCILQLPSGSPVPSNEVLAICASIAAYYSKAKHSSSVPVDYCFVKYVHKPNKSKPGMVIYKNNKTLYVTPRITHILKPGSSFC